MQSHFDLIIVGGGLTGIALALALQNQNFRIAIIDSQKEYAEKSTSFKDARSLALSFMSCKILSSLGIWKDIVDNAFAINQVHISDQGRFGFSRIHSEKEGVTALGYVVDYDELENKFHNHLFKSNIEVISQAKVQSITFTDTANLVIEKNSETYNFSAKLVVAADGGNSAIRNDLQIPTYEYDYQQTALVANIGLQKDHQNVAYERFTKLGPMAMLPLGEKRYAMVWSLSAENAQKFLHEDEEIFLQELQKSFGHRLGKLTWVGKRQIFPLKLLYAKQCAHTRVLFVGNACHNIHPIAGQGFNLGLRDVMCVKEILSEFLSNDDHNISNIMQQYQNKRTRDHKEIITFTDQLVKIFSKQKQPLIFMRNLGLCGFDFMPGIKHFAARRLMGYI